MCQRLLLNTAPATATKLRQQIEKELLKNSPIAPTAFGKHSSHSNLPDLFNALRSMTRVLLYVLTQSPEVIVHAVRRDAKDLGDLPVRVTMLTQRDHASLLHGDAGYRCCY